MRKTLVKLLVLLTLGAVICLPGMALASIMGFDDLTANQDSNTWGFVPASYQGFTWTGFEFITNAAFTTPYGNTGNFPSPSNAAYNGDVGNLTVTIDFGAKRDVLDAYFRSFGQNNAFQSFSAQTVTLKGLDAADNVIDTLVVNLSAAAMVDPTINFYGVNKLSITSDRAGHYWVMDNLTTVPLPPTLLLLGSGLVGLIGLRRKPRRGNMDNSL